MEYTWEEVQDLLTAIPAERLVNLNLKLTESEYKKKFLEAIFDEVAMDTSKIDEFIERRRKKKQNVGL